MDVHEAIRKRCSVRTYLDRPVEDDKLMRVLEAARLSPSARNDQKRKFIVVRYRQKLAALERASGQSFVGRAPVVIATVSTDPHHVMHCGVPSAPVDCAIAIDHMTLAAVAEGLGTCWVGHFDQDACRTALGVPKGAQIIELLALGYPVEGADQPEPKLRKPLDELICWETFSV
jgi:nitroreductase